MNALEALALVLPHEIRARLQEEYDGKGEPCRCGACHVCAARVVWRLVMHRVSQQQQLEPSPSPFLTRRQVEPVRSAPPWRLCPEPARWQHFGDGMGGVELETLGFLEALVWAIKPEVVLETGTFTGSSAGALARGCRRNGFGHVWSWEIDGARAEQAGYFLQDEGLAPWVTVVVGDALQADLAQAGGLIDLLFLDGGEERAAELELFTRRLSARALVGLHDAAAHELAVLRVPGFHRILVPTPTGLMLLQRA